MSVIMSDMMVKTTQNKIRNKRKYIIKFLKQALILPSLSHLMVILVFGGDGPSWAITNSPLVIVTN